MADFCERCGAELGVFSREKIKLGDGRELSVCDPCAAKAKAGAPSAFGELSAQPRPAPGRAAPPPAFGPAPTPAPGGSARIPIVSIALLLALTVAGGVVYALLAGGADARTATEVVQQPVAAPPQPPASAPAVAKNEAQARADAWDGTGQFSCRAGERVTLHCKAGAHGSVRADGDCTLTLEACQLANLNARGTAKVTMDGGGVGNPGIESVRVSDTAALTIKNATLTGLRTAARVEGQGTLILQSVTVRQQSDDRQGRVMPPAALSAYESGTIVIDGGTINWSRQGVALQENALLLARNANIKVEPMLGQKSSTAAVFLSGGARGLIVGGTLEGPETAVIAGGSASVSLEGTTLRGTASQSGNASVSQSKESPNADKSLADLQRLLAEGRDSAKAKYELTRRYAREACAGVFECYADAGYSGPVKGKITTRVDEQGKLGAVAMVGVPGNVATCIRKHNRDRSVPEFEGPSGTLKCEYTGTVTPHSRMLSTSADYLMAK